MIPNVQAPPSKSLTHRALFCAFLAKGESTIQNPLCCEDTEATLQVLEALGAKVEKGPGHWKITGGHFKKPSEELFCNESGTTWRFLTAVTSALGIPCKITGKPSLLRRPMGHPFTSQFLSGQLLAAPLAKKETCIKLPAPPVSKPYIVLTLAVQKEFGVEVTIENNFSKFKIAPQSYRPTKVKMEGDWSAAACLLSLGVLAKEVRLVGLNPNSLQGDKAIITILKEMGGDIGWEEEVLVARPSALKAISWDLSQTPDLYPIVAVLCALAKGKSHLTGIERLCFKESDRMAAMKKITTGCLAPYGNSKFLSARGATRAPMIDSRDHRIIMAAAVLGRALNVKMEFKHPECVAKSWPGFWEVFQSL